MRNSNRYKVGCSLLPLTTPNIINNEHTISLVNEITTPINGTESSEHIVKGIENSHVIGLYYDSFLGFTNTFKEKFGYERIEEYEVFRISNQSIPMIIMGLLLISILFVSRGSFQNLWHLNNYFLMGFIIAGVDVLVLTVVIVLRTLLYIKVNITSKKLLIWKKRMIPFYSSRAGRALENFLIVTAPLGLGFYGLGRINNPCSIDPPSMWNAQECNPNNATNGVPTDWCIFQIIIVLIVQMLVKGCQRVF